MDKKNNISKHEKQRKLAVYTLYGHTYVFDSLAQNDRFPVEIVLSNTENNELATWQSALIKNDVRHITGNDADVFIKTYKAKLSRALTEESKQKSIIDKVDMLRAISNKKNSNLSMKSAKLNSSFGILRKPYPNDIVIDPIHYEYGLGIITQVSGKKIMVVFSGMPWPIDYGSEGKPRRLKRIASWVDSTKEKHKKILKHCGKIYRGATRIENVFEKRTAFCWLCKSSINNMESFTCDGCGWIICSCGACGCNFSK